VQLDEFGKIQSLLLCNMESVCRFIKQYIKKLGVASIFLQNIPLVAAPTHYVRA